MHDFWAICWVGGFSWSERIGRRETAITHDRFQSPRSLPRSLLDYFFIPTPTLFTAASCQRRWVLYLFHLPFPRRYLSVLLDLLARIGFTGFTRVLSIQLTHILAHFFHRRKKIRNGYWLVVDLIIIENKLSGGTEQAGSTCSAFFTQRDVGSMVNDCSPCRPTEITPHDLLSSLDTNIVSRASQCVV